MVAAPRLRASARALMPETPPAQNRSVAFMLRRNNVNRAVRLVLRNPDEPFRRRDIQFDNPQVRVLFGPAIQIFGNFVF